MAVKLVDHPKRCQCERCIAARAAAYAERADACRKGGAVPRDADATIPVRAHFRRGRNHLSSDPGLKSAVELLIAAWLTKGRKRTG